ncbi:MAG: hypothetical protein LUH49_10340, partial [Cloacibacillus porcorum]|uniref:hypothetical protein n=1 Tax=Cloacibacillus porcorum TaxID=1197717 RepID=UPI0023F50BCA
YYTELSKSTVQVLLTSAVNGVAVRVNNGNETNITIKDGTLSIEGSEWDGAAYVSDGGKLIFSGGDITLENKYNAYWVDTVRVVGADSKVFFHNNNTLIKGKSSYGLTLLEGAAGYAENLTIALDRSGGIYDQKDVTLGIWIDPDGSFEANGMADISVKGSNTYDRLVEALYINDGQTVNFNKTTSLKAEGGADQAYGIFADKAEGINFKDKLTVSAKDAVFSNTGLYLNEIDKATFNGLDVVASGGDSVFAGITAAGVIVRGAGRIFFNGETSIAAIDNASVNNGMLVENNTRCLWAGRR